MATRWFSFTILIVLFIETSNCAKSAFQAYSYYDDHDNDDNDSKTFIVPQVNPDTNLVYCVYKKERISFMIMKMPGNYYVAETICYVQNARLAVLDNMEKASFVAKCFAALDFKVDSLWVGGTRNDKNVWEWRKTDSDSEPITDDILGRFIINKNVQADDRACLTFDRENHEAPQFRPITCNGERYSLCDTKNKVTPDDRGIQIGNFNYRIFFDESVDYETARERCIWNYHGRVAEIRNYTISQELGRYLLVHRAKLENAWIGATYSNEKKGFVFDTSEDVLSNVTDEHGYPPWINNTVQTASGCVLLDRHLSNITYFIPDSCDRRRPYICSRRRDVPDNTTEVDFSDVIIDDYGYRLQHHPEDWQNASYICKIKYKKYDGKLVEIREEKQVSHLLYVMGENETAVQHIWMGGRLDEKRSPPVWVWDSNGEPIPTTGAERILNWVINTTYDDHVETINNCLNMDRENHRVPLFYGTNCVAIQKYVCLFTAENLRRLEKDEKEENDHDRQK